MTSIHKRITAAALVIFGVLFILKNFLLLEIDSFLLAGGILVFYGLASVYHYLGTQRRDQIIISSMTFLIGIIFFIYANYELVDTKTIVLFSILFISGALLFMLFADNARVKVFLYAGIALAAVSYSALVMINEFALNRPINLIIKKAGYMWPAFLIVLGIFLFIKRKK